MPGLDVAGFTAWLVATNSVTRNPNIEIAGTVEPLIRRARFEIERLEFRDTTGVPKVGLVEIKGAGAGTLGFNSHLDTVPGTVCDRDPWTQVIEGDRLGGLGNCGRDRRDSVATADSSSH
jgi:acetylornithine deacetylase/succinyl-diaminopimelate desuccinylase-like protein